MKPQSPPLQHTSPHPSQMVTPTADHALQSLSFIPPQYIYICTHTCTQYTCTHMASMYLGMHTDVFICTQACIHTHTFMHIHPCTHTGDYVHISVGTHPTHSFTQAYQHAYTRSGASLSVQQSPFKYHCGCQSDGPLCSHGWSEYGLHVRGQATEMGLGVFSCPPPLSEQPEAAGG